MLPLDLSHPIFIMSVFKGQTPHTAARLRVAFSSPHAALLTQQLNSWPSEVLLAFICVLQSLATFLSPFVQGTSLFIS